MVLSTLLSLALPPICKGVVIPVHLHSAGRISKLNQMLGDCHYGGRERILQVEMTLSKILMSLCMKTGMQQLSWRVK